MNDKDMYLLDFPEKKKMTGTKFDGGKRAEKQWLEEARKKVR